MSLLPRSLEDARNRRPEDFSATRLHNAKDHYHQVCDRQEYPRDAEYRQCHFKRGRHAETRFSIFAGDHSEYSGDEEEGRNNYLQKTPACCVNAVLRGSAADVPLIESHHKHDNAGEGRIEYRKWKKSYEPEGPGGSAVEVYVGAPGRVVVSGDIWPQARDLLPIHKLGRTRIPLARNRIIRRWFGWWCWFGWLCVVWCFGHFVTFFFVGPFGCDDADVIGYGQVVGYVHVLDEVTRYFIQPAAFKNGFPGINNLLTAPVIRAGVHRAVAHTLRGHPIGKP